MSEPIPPDEWGLDGDGRSKEAQDGTDHAFPPRPEVVAVTQSQAAESVGGEADHRGYVPDGAPVRGAPDLLRPELFRRPPWRRPPGQQDDLGEPGTVFAPDTRAVIYDTTYPWRTCGRVATPGGWGSGVMVGRRHMMTASHVVPWLPGGGSDWLTFTPMQYDTSTPFGSAHVTRIYWWQQVNGGDGIQSNEAAFDYVVCVLSDPLGDAVGWMGSIGYSADWNGQVRWAHIGYPWDIGSGVRPVYTTNGVMDSTVTESFGGHNAFRVMHRNDVTPGQSGGPYFGWFTGDGFPRVIVTQSAENWGMAGGPNAGGGGQPLPDLIIHATTVEP
jgi:V8-like Glu-specific endopeptidase